MRDLAKKQNICKVLKNFKFKTLKTKKQIYLKIHEKLIVIKLSKPSF